MLPGLINTLTIINFVALLLSTYNITLLELRTKAGWQNGTCMLIVGSCSPNMPQISRGKIPKFLIHTQRFDQHACSDCYEWKGMPEYMIFKGT